MLAWGCRRSNPGGGLAPLSTPPLFRAGGCALILYNFESKMQKLIFRQMYRKLAKYSGIPLLHVEIETSLEFWL